MSKHTNAQSASATNDATKVVRFRLGKSDKIEIDGKPYAMAAKADDGYVLRNLELPDICQEFHHDDLNDMLRDGRLAVQVNHYRPGSALARMSTSEICLSDLSERRQSRWAINFELVNSFLEDERAGKVSRSDKCLRNWIDEFFAAKLANIEGRYGSSMEYTKPPSPSTLRRIIRRFEACDHDPFSLVDSYGRSGNRDRRITGARFDLMKEHAERYMSNLKPSMAQLYKHMKSDFEKKLPGEAVPSRNAFERAIRRLDPFHVLAAREGEAAARRKLWAVRQHMLATRPLERVEMDDQEIPLQTMLESAGIWKTISEDTRKKIEKKRFWLCKAIDAYSRVPLGFVITDNPTVESALATVRQIFMDKTPITQSLKCGTALDMYGRPEMIVTDRGANYISRIYQAACLDVGIQPWRGPSKTPQMRGRIERSFRRENDEFFVHFSGRTFENIAERGDYKPEDHVSLLIDELGRLLVRYYADVYLNTPHSALAGDTPLNVWRKGVERFGIIPPPSADVIRHVFGTAVEARIRNRGICIAGLYYQSRSLQEARRTVKQKTVLVRVDVEDLGHVSVRTPSGWLTVPCATNGFNGVSLDTWDAAQADLRRKNASIAALSEETVNRAIDDITKSAEWARKRSNVPSPIMTSKQLVEFDRRLRTGFDMERPETGPDIFADEVDHDEVDAIFELDDDVDHGLELPGDEYFTE